MKLKVYLNAFIASALLLIALPSWSENTFSINDVFNETIVGASAGFIAININVGEFSMGSPKEESNRNNKDETLHRVRLSQGFEIQATEITQLQWAMVMGKNPSFVKEQQFCDKDNYLVLKRRIRLCKNHPVEKVSLTKHVTPFLQALNQAQDQYTYRLPTETEWELAARGGTTPDMPYSFGSHDLEQINAHAWHADNSKNAAAVLIVSHAVATKKPNPFGLYDIHGNVWEWTQDQYDSNYGFSGAGLEDVITDPVYKNRTATSNVARGGSYKNQGHGLRSAIRKRTEQSLPNATVGLRLVRVSR